MHEIIAHVVQPTDWLQLISSICSIVISVIAVIISVITYRSQKEHNKNSVRPILNIIIGDYEDDLYVRIENNGVGPGIITDINCYSKNSYKKSLFELIPNEARVTSEHSGKIVKLHTFTDFVEDITGRTIAPDQKITLLKLENPDGAQRMTLRYILKDIAIEIKYTDIYNSPPRECKRELIFFGRHLINSTTQISYSAK